MHHMGKEQTPNKIPEQDDAIALGRAELARQGINPDDYREYFEVMRDNDVPVINQLPDFMFIETLGMESLERAEKKWAALKQRYDAIDLAKQNEHTGKEIIIVMKGLLDQFGGPFAEYARKARETKTIVAPSPELIKLRKKIVELAHRYTDQVPAYRAYRHVGRFELDPLGRRGFQMENDDNG